MLAAAAAAACFFGCVFLAPLIEATGADELMVTAAIWDHKARVRSYELLAQAVG